MDCSYPIDNAVRLLNDSAHVRWPLVDLVAFLNEGIREVVRVKPTASVRTITMSLAPGIHQQIPTDAQQLIAVERDVNSGGAVRLVSEQALQSVMPLWAAAGASTTIKEWMFDTRDPRSFLVYPPAVGQTPLAITVVQRINPIGVPVDPAPWPAFPLPDEYADPITTWILYRAFLAPTGGGSQSRALAYQQSFYQSLGVATQAATEPKAEDAS